MGATDLVYNIARRMVRGAEDGRDLVQETYLAAYSAWAKGRRPEPELRAAAYVSGEMRRRELRRFEAHLVECEECWREVSLGWKGRGLAEASREVAPPGLRDEIRAALSIAPRPSRVPRRLAV